MRGQGLSARVLKSGRWVELGEDFEVLCQPFSLLDSWMAIRAGGQQIVNLNDCTLDSEEAARQVLSSVGDRPIDLVMLQYSFGGYAGETAQERLDAGSHMLWRIQMVSRILRPRFFMPCASFTWFCHRENHHLNAQSNRIQKVFRFMEKRCHGQPIVLLPGESWEVGTAHKSKKAVGRYRAAFAEKLRATDLRTSSSVDGPELQALAQGFLKRLKKANPDWEALRRFHMIEPTAIFVVDQDCAWELHPDRGLNPVSVSASDCDVALASGSLAHALRLPWGGSTVGINGRFTKPPGGYYERFKAWFAISVYNHHKKAPVPEAVLKGAALKWERRFGDSGTAVQRP